MKSRLTFIVLLTMCIPTHAQKVFTRELALVVDNDYPYLTDQYYTAGQDITYRRIVNSKILFFNHVDSGKTILGLRYGNKAFTPKNVDTNYPPLMDRPYCGWSFISAEIQHFKRKNSSNQLSLELGVVGPASGMGQIQQWWHQQIHLYAIEGWNSQIANEVVVNASYSHTHEFPLTKWSEILSSSSVIAGTGSNKASQEFTLRLFSFHPIRESSFNNATIGNSASVKPEFFIYGTGGVNYILSNIFIQGSLFNHNSVYTTDIEPWLFYSKVGFQYSTNHVSWGLAFVHLGRETPKVVEENYASAKLSIRF